MNAIDFSNFVWDKPGQKSPLNVFIKLLTITIAILSTDKENAETNYFDFHAALLCPERIVKVVSCPDIAVRV